MCVFICMWLCLLLSSREPACLWVCDCVEGGRVCVGLQVWANFVTGYNQDGIVRIGMMACQVINSCPMQMSDQEYKLIP